MINQYRHPIRFYFFSAVFAWIFWFVAAWFSHQPAEAGYGIYVSLFGLMGLSAPLLVAAYYIGKDKVLLGDVAGRLFHFGSSGRRYGVFTLVLMPASIVLAMAISLLFGYDIQQFTITGEASFSSGVFPVWFMLLLAPIVEELAWHSYGTDCLRQKFSVFNTSIIFAVYWTLWHVPLAFIQGYYHSNLVDLGVLHSVNFMLSIFPFVLLMNWLYYKTNRNILVPVVFHLFANVFNEIFSTHPDSKVIQTVLLSVLVFYLLYVEREFFFRQLAMVKDRGSMLLSVGLVFVTLTGTANADSLILERRKNQFPSDSGHILAPVPYSIPGIGDGLFLMANFSNTFGSTADATLVGITGEARGISAQIQELPLYRDHLFLRAEKMHISTVAVNNYDNRGMHNNGNDFSLMEISKYNSDTLGLDLTFFQRQLSFSVDHKREIGNLDTIRDAKGLIINDFSNDPFVFKNRLIRWGMQLDLTDDYLDAQEGLRLDFVYQDVPPASSNDPDSFVTELNASLFLPTFGQDTLVLNYYQSDAHVRKKGNTDPAAIRGELGFQCGASDAQCQHTESELVNKFIAQRRFGTASSLGGNNRFRAYPQGRFDGAHVQFVGAEYRMNFVRDKTPFNLFFWKDKHTGYQLAFFSEYATVADTWGELWDASRLVAGTGLRLVTASGSVYRADLAAGDEGAELSLYFFYPWK